MPRDPVARGEQGAPEEPLKDATPAGEETAGGAERRSAGRPPRAGRERKPPLPPRDPRGRKIRKPPNAPRGKRPKGGGTGSGGSAGGAPGGGGAGGAGGMPQLDEGTFTIERVGSGLPHPVAWAWRCTPAGGATFEVWAMLHVDNVLTGFIRPGAGVASVVYTFTWVPNSAGNALHHASANAFVAWILEHYGAAVPDVGCLSVITCTDTGLSSVNGTAVFPDGVLRSGNVMVRRTPTTGVVALGWHPAFETARENWALKGPIGLAGSWKPPGQGYTPATYYFYGLAGSSEEGFLDRVTTLFGSQYVLEKHRVDG